MIIGDIASELGRRHTQFLIKKSIQMDTVLLVKIISLIIYPLGMSFALLLLGLALYVVKFRKLGLSGGVFSVVVLMLASNPMVARHIASSLESQHPQQALNDMVNADAILVLGGGLRLPIPPAQHTQVSSGSDRYWYAVRLYKAGKANKIILSGGNVFTQKGFKGEAHYAAQLLEEWGVEKADIIIEQGSRTTAQNAQKSNQFLQQHNIESILLVTSALHMPRSYDLFKDLSVKVIPASADVLIQNVQYPKILKWLPSAHALLLTTVSMHEYYGMWSKRFMS